MLSDFYLPSPLPPLPFHNREDIAYDELLTLSSSDDLAPHSSSRTLPPFLDEHDHNRCARSQLGESSGSCHTKLVDVDRSESTEGVEHVRVLIEEEGVTMSPPRLLSSEQTHHRPSPAESTAALSSPMAHWSQDIAGNWVSRHIDACPDCAQETDGRHPPLPHHQDGPIYTIMDDDTDVPGAMPYLSAAHSPGDTTDGTTMSSPRHGYQTPTELFYPAAAPSSFYTPNAVPSWEGTGYYAPVLRDSTISTAPLHPAVSPSASGFDGRVVPFGCDDSFDGSIYGWPASSSPTLDDASMSNIYSCHPTSFTHGSLCSTVVSPLATAVNLQSSYPSYPSSSSSSAAGASSWFTPSPHPPTLAPPLLVGRPLMPSTMVPLATINGTAAAIPIDTKAADTAQKRKRQSSANPGRPGSPHICTECGADKTPEWRRGPCGPRTLCNACGLRYAKRNKKKREEENAANGQPQGGTTAGQPQSSRKPRSKTGSPVLGGRRSPSPPPILTSTASYSTTPIVTPTPRAPLGVITAILSAPSAP